MEHTTGRRWRRKHGLAPWFVLALGWLGQEQGAWAAQAGASAAANPYGAPAPLAQAARQVALTPCTRWVNVDDGETVQFLAHGASFTWRFCTPRGQAVFDLDRIAPAQGHFPDVRVYVASNPLTHN